MFGTIKFSPWLEILLCWKFLLVYSYYNCEELYVVPFLELSSCNKLYPCLIWEWKGNLNRVIESRSAGPSLENINDPTYTPVWFGYQVTRLL